MATASAGIFTIDYTLRTNADPGSDIQFGMDFSVTQAKTSAQLALTQLIFPATSVGTNTAGVWNIDNHEPAGKDPNTLIFAKAQNGVIKDIPTELSKRNRGILTTKFAIYRVDPSKAAVQIHGAAFGYSIDTGAAQPVTRFTGIAAQEITNEQKKLILARCSIVKFV